MKIAIIGGGASGLITAHLLNRNHEIHVFEKSPVLGGNVKTLNKNAEGNGLPANVFIENGVSFFPDKAYPNFRKLMENLGVELIRDNASIALYLNHKNRYTVKNPQLREELIQFLQYANTFSERDFKGKPVASFIGSYSPLFQTWIKSILMMSYSMPFQYMDRFPAEIAMPLLTVSLTCKNAFYVKDGVYSYFENILKSFSGKIFVNSAIKKVERHPDFILLHFADGQTGVYDKVIFATTPEQTLNLLVHPTAAEKRRFSPWKTNRITTIAHTDTAVYQNNQNQAFSFVDFFYNSGTKIKEGYNSYMNDVYRIANGKSYFMAYNVSDRIDPKKILNIQRHTTPFYSVDALRYRHEIRETNGQHHTYHVGAYLGNGLHEGAVNSALEVYGLLV